MTGEMATIDMTGLDSNGVTWGLHADIAKQVGGELRPFDVYQGPYIQTPKGRLWVHIDPESEYLLIITLDCYKAGKHCPQSTAPLWPDDTDLILAESQALLND